MNRQDRFTKIFKDNEWRGMESKSGKGSSLSGTIMVRDFIERIKTRYNISSVLDAGCGDFWWMREIAGIFPTYTGVDIVPEMVQFLKVEYPNFNFYDGDIVSHVPDAYDLIICRDVLVHLSNASVLQVLRNFRDSGSKFLLATTFAHILDNKDIRDGGWRPINLFLKPFNMPTTLHSMQECPSKEFMPHESPENELLLYLNKVLCLWRLS